MRKSMPQDFSYLNLLAIEQLENIGIQQPTQQQIDLMELLLRIQKY